MFNYNADFPFHRGRRLRNNNWIRELVAENYVSVNDLIWPIFVVDGQNRIEPIIELPGINRYSIDKLLDIVKKPFEEFYNTYFDQRKWKNWIREYAVN